MFKKLFGILFSKKQEASAKKAPERDLFKKLFPLTEKNKSFIENRTNSILEDMHGEENRKVLQSYTRDYPSKVATKKALEFESFDWKLEKETETSATYSSPEGDILLIDLVAPNGTLSKDKPSELLVYRSWLRDSFAQQNGGLIYCEEFRKPDGLEGFESIVKMPREGSTGMDYIYFLNLRNYDEQKLYQIHLKIFEMSPTGLRDNLMMHSFSDVLEVDFGELMELYRQDPYDKTYTKGNRMNLSEREEFDALFAFHPLSIIRRELRQRLFDSVKFN